MTDPQEGTSMSPRNKRTESCPAVKEVLNRVGDKWSVQIVDLLFITKDEQGQVRVFELTDLAPDLLGRFEPLANEVTPLLNEVDAHELAETVAHDTVAGPDRPPDWSLLCGGTSRKVMVERSQAVQQSFRHRKTT